MNQNKLQVSGQFLYSFTVVAKHMSFTKAAEDLCITQSAVSHRIRCLEQELGFPLFHRLTRKIILTEEGKTLYGALDASLKQIHETIRKYSGGGAAGGSRHRLRPFHRGLLAAAAAAGISARASQHFPAHTQRQRPHQL